MKSHEVENPLHVTLRPTRGDLLRVIAELQVLVGRAKNAFENDRDPDRESSVRDPLTRAFELCIEARQYDPAEPRTRSANLWRGRR